MGRASIVFAAAAILALATTRVSPHVAPSALVLAAAALVVTAALLVPERWRRPAAIAAAVVAGLAAEHVLTRPGMPQVHDVDHVWGLWAYARAVRSGHVLPLWMPWIGAGMPLLQFYGPVSFLAALPAILAGLAPVAIWKWALAQASVLSALAALAGARLLGASWRGALLAACALAFAPWKSTVFHYRGALGEATAFALAPLVAAAALAMLRAPGRRAAWVLGSAIALLIPTHLITLFCLAIALVPAALVEVRAGWTRRLAVAAIPAILGAGLVAAWWVPALAEGGRTSLPFQTESHRYLVYREHGLTAADLFVRRGWDRMRISLKRSDRAAGQEGQQMPFYFGWTLLAAGVTAPWWSRSRSTWGPACGAAVAVALSSGPAADVMAQLPLVNTLQFPWRFLSAGSVLAALAVGSGAGAFLESAGSSWRRLLPVLALPALLIADGAPYTGASSWIPPYRGVTHWAYVPGQDPNGPFELARRAVPQDLGHGGGMVRVGGLYLPPDTTATPVELSWIAYIEWTTPPFSRGLLATQAPEEFGEAGVTWFFVPERDRPIPIPGKPYATLVSGAGEADAGAFVREPGAIALRPVVPEGGARLIVREQAFPGWVARVDGREVAIEPAPLGFMSLSLPAGAHAVELDYTQRTPARIAGLAVSAAAVLALLLLAGGKSGDTPLFVTKR